MDGLQAGYRHISLRTEGNFPLALPTIFCQIILKSYVPDGLSAFVDQLNKPIIKKTDELLNSPTINSYDSGLISSTSSVRRFPGTDSGSASTPSLDTKSTITTTGASNMSVNTISTNDMNSFASSSTKSKAPAEIIPPITLEYLREHKNFCKLKQKQDKELLQMKKKHAKEQSVLGEQQSKMMSKMKTDSEKMIRSPLIHTGNTRKEIR